MSDAINPVPPSTPAPAGDVVRDQDKIMLVLSYLGLLALVPYLMVKDSEYVRWHAKQGLALAICEVGWFVVSGILSSVLSLWGLTALLSLLVNIGFLVLTIIGIVKALEPNRWKIPVVSDLAAKL